MVASNYAYLAVLAFLTTSMLACGGRKSRSVEAAAPSKCEVGKRLAADGKSCEAVPVATGSGTGGESVIAPAGGTGSGNGPSGGVGAGTGSGSNGGLGSGGGSVPSGGLGSGGGSVPSGGLGSGGGSVPSGGLGSGNGGLLGSLGSLFGTGSGGGSKTGTGGGSTTGTGGGSRTGTGGGSTTGTGGGSKTGSGSGSGSGSGTKTGTGSGASVAPGGGSVYAHLVSTPSGDATTVAFASDSAGSKVLNDVTYRVIQDVTLATREATSSGYRISIDKLNIEARRSAGSSVFCTGVSYTGWVKCSPSKEVTP